MKDKLENWISFLLMAGCFVYLIIRWKDQNDLRAGLGSIWILAGSMVASYHIKKLIDDQAKLRFVYICIVLVISLIIFDDNMTA